MARPLAVEREAVIAARRSRPCPSRPGDGKLSGSTREAGRRGKLAISGLERVLGEGREDVGEEQLLVLLLVIDAELDQLERRRRQLGSARSSASSTWRAIGADLVERRAAEHPALGPRVPLAFALVIAVEQDRRSARRTAGSRARGRAARRSRRTSWCGRGAIWPARRRERAGSPRRRRCSGAARSSVSLRVANSCEARLPWGRGRARVAIGAALKRKSESWMSPSLARVAPGCHSTSPPSPFATSRASTNRWSDRRLR